MNTPLRDWRIASGKTAEEVARLIGVTPPMWSRWETGRRQVPAERTLEIERMTGVSRHELRPDVFGPAPEAAQ